MRGSHPRAAKSMSESRKNSDIREILRSDIRQCPLSRQQIAYSLSEATGRRITVAQLDAYCAQTKPHRFPAEMIAAWVRITGSRRLLDAIAMELGYVVATAEDIDFAELGRTTLRGDKLRQKLWERL
jgi:hypothetical protein